jgi:hypothetical protein
MDWSSTVMATAEASLSVPVTRSSGGTSLLAALAYLAVVLCMWVPFNVRSGMPYETGFPLTSETTKKIDGFFYQADPMRIHTNTFYHLAYLLGEYTGQAGSFLPYQIVYAALWWARGFLVYLIVRRFLPKHQLFAFLTGALVLVHAADSTINWVGQLNQFGYLFWMILAFYCQVRAYQMQNESRAGLLMLFMMFFVYMSMWSYEAQLVILLAAPLLLGLLPEGYSWRRLFQVAAGWYLVLGVYIYKSYVHYKAVGNQTYQATVLRTDFSIGAILSDLWFNLTHSVDFLAWAESIRTRPVPGGTGLLLGFGLTAVVIVGVAGCLLLWRGRSEVADQVATPPLKTLWLTLCTGLLLMTLSFPIYLLLNSSRMLWRTQFLSGFGAALMLVSVACLLARLCGKRRSMDFLAVCLCLPVVYFGTCAANRFGAFHYGIWERHRQAMAQVLAVAPRVKPNTLIILTNVPLPRTGEDPFGHQYWFDLALRLAYPRTPVAGVYFYEDGKPAPGNIMKLKGDRWECAPIGWTSSIERTVVVRYDRNQHPQLLMELPSYLEADHPMLARFDPKFPIEAGPPPARALRRYRPLPSATGDVLIR